MATFQAHPKKVRAAQVGRRNIHEIDGLLLNWMSVFYDEQENVSSISVWDLVEGIQKAEVGDWIVVELNEYEDEPEHVSTWSDEAFRRWFQPVTMDAMEMVERQE